MKALKVYIISSSLLKTQHISLIFLYHTITHMTVWQLFHAVALAYKIDIQKNWMAQDLVRSITVGLRSMRSHLKRNTYEHHFHFTGALWCGRHTCKYWRVVCCTGVDKFRMLCFTMTMQVSNDSLEQGLNL